MEVSLFGKGFVGGVYYDKFKDVDNITVIPRYSRRSKEGSDILYTISTVDNYNVFTDPTIDVKTNLVVLTEALESWKNINPNGTFLFLSSWFVYGNKDSSNQHYFCEDDYCNPKGFYSITKRCAEQLLISYAETFGLNYKILRLGNVLGIEDNKVSAKKNALQYLIEKMKRGEDIELYDGGDFYRNYMHVDDCVCAINTVIKTGKINNIYNIGSQYNYKFRDMVDYVASTINYSGKIKIIEQKDFHRKVQSKSFLMDTCKLRSLGFVQKYKMEDMLNSLL